MFIIYFGFCTSETFQSHKKIDKYLMFPLICQKIVAIIITYFFCRRIQFMELYMYMFSHDITINTIGNVFAAKPKCNRPIFANFLQINLPFVLVTTEFVLTGLFSILRVKAEV